MKKKKNEYWDELGELNILGELGELCGLDELDELECPNGWILKFRILNILIWTY